MIVAIRTPLSPEKSWSLRLTIASIAYGSLYFILITF